MSHISGGAYIFLINLRVYPSRSGKRGSSKKSGSDELSICAADRFVFSPACALAHDPGVVLEDSGVPESRVSLFPTLSTLLEDGCFEESDFVRLGVMMVDDVGAKR